LAGEVDWLARSGAVTNAALTEAAIDAALAHIVTGDAPLRVAARVTVHDQVGLPWQEPDLSWILYNAAQARDRRTRPTWWSRGPGASSGGTSSLDSG
jgi:hypothetical protein